MRINCFKGIVTARSDTPYNVEAGLMSRAEQEGASEPESLDVTRNRRWIYRTEGREFAGRVSPPFPYSYRRPDLIHPVGLAWKLVVVGLDREWRQLEIETSK